MAHAMPMDIRDTLIMRTQFGLRAAAALVSAHLLAALPAGAAPDDYRFQLVETEMRQCDGAEIAVTLVDQRNGNPVGDAVIFATRLDMAPDGMEAMTTPVEAMPSIKPGTYRFKANLVMEGQWRLSLAAKVQGEPGTVQARLNLRVVP